MIIVYTLSVYNIYCNAQVLFCFDLLLLMDFLRNCLSVKTFFSVFFGNDFFIFFVLFIICLVHTQLPCTTKDERYKIKDINLSTWRCDARCLCIVGWYFVFVMGRDMKSRRKAISAITLQAPLYKKKSEPYFLFLHKSMQFQL